MNCQGTFSIQSAVTRSGNYAAHFVKPPNTPTGKRCELTFGDIGRFYWGIEYWVGFSFNIPFSPTGNRVLNQHHSVPGPIGNPDWYWSSGGNGFTIRMPNNDDNKFDIRLIPSGNESLNFYSNCTIDNDCPGSAAGGTNVYYSWDTEFNRWYDIVLNFRYSDESDGFFKVWIDGVNVIDITGSNVHLHDVIGRLKARRNYLQLGIYTGPSGDGEIFYDEIRIGHENSSYADVAPGGGTLSISDEVFNNEISIFPNPTTNTFIIDLKDETLEKIVIYNQLGQQVKETPIVSETNQVDVSNLSNGIYFIKITSQSGKTATKKIIN